MMCPVCTFAVSRVQSYTANYAYTAWQHNGKAPQWSAIVGPPQKKVPSMKLPWWSMRSGERWCWEILGWNEFLWAEQVEGKTKSPWYLRDEWWVDVWPHKRRILEDLGWDSYSWNRNDHIGWERCGWCGMSPWYQSKWMELGVTQKLYERWKDYVNRDQVEGGLWPDSVAWDTMTAEEQAACKWLGFDEETWNIKRMMDPERFFANWDVDCDAVITSICDPFSVTWAYPSLLHPKVFVCLGCHPKTAGMYGYSDRSAFTSNMTYPDYENKLLALFHKLNSESSGKIIAWGECGFDFAKADDDIVRKSETRIFKRHIEFAIRFKLPIVVHSREAERDTLEVMMAHIPKNWKIHMHGLFCSKEMTDALLDHFPNLFIGFTLALRNYESLEDQCRNVPLDRIVAETDSPYLPSIYDAGTNLRPLWSHSSEIPLVLQKVAEVKQIEEEEAFRAVRRNVRFLYGI